MAHILDNFSKNMLSRTLLIPQLMIILLKFTNDLLSHRKEKKFRF